MREATCHSHQCWNSLTRTRRQRMSDLVRLVRIALKNYVIFCMGYKSRSDTARDFGSDQTGFDCCGRTCQIAVFTGVQHREPRVLVSSTSTATLTVNDGIRCADSIETSMDVRQFCPYPLASPPPVHFSFPSFLEASQWQMTSARRLLHRDVVQVFPASRPSQP